MLKKSHFKMFFMVLTVVLSTGCSGIGSGTVARDRFDYVNAISDSWKKQMLLNLIKIRYVDAPVFLEVSTIINQYEVEGQINLGASWNAADSQTLGGSGRYADRPTIAYSLLTGEKFYRSLMTPIPVRGLLFLVEADYPVDFLFRIAVQTINGVDNRFGAGLIARDADPRFSRLVEALRRIQISGTLGMRITPLDKEKVIAMFFRANPGEEIVKDLETVRQVLGLRTDANEFRVVYGSLAADDQEIAILTRSMLDIMVELGSYIDVPEKDVAEGRVLAASFEGDTGVPPLIRIRSGEKRPDKAFVAVKYRDLWFWVDDTDFSSKRMFTFLMLLFSLTETGDRAPAPILTVPTN